MKEIKELYEGLMKVFQRYLDMEAPYYKVCALWSIGSHFHKMFSTFPYLYLNASRGSGKTRLLKLIAYFSRNGRVLALPSEAFLFRKADTMTFCLDELEGLQAKEKGDLRLLLNTAYKKGLFIPRVDKDKKDDSGEMETNEYETFAPIAIANIWGLESVLQDRCVSLILEKSHNEEITKKVEAWDLEMDCIRLKESLQKIDSATYEVSFFGITKLEDMKYVPIIWNAVLENLREIKDFDQAFSSLDWDIFKLEPSDDLLKFLRMLYEVKIEGRDLELWLPLFFVAYMVDEETLKNVIEIATGCTEQKRVDEIGLNSDSDLMAVLSDFIKGKSELEFFRPMEIKNAMAEVVGEEKTNRDGSTRIESPYWLNNEWVGRGLKRLNVIKQKRRRSGGVEVMLNFPKIEEKAKALGYFTDVQTRIQIPAHPTEPTQHTQHTQPTLRNDVGSVGSVGNVGSVGSVGMYDVSSDKGKDSEAIDIVDMEDDAPDDWEEEGDNE